MRTRLSIDTHFETYRAIIARTKNFISDDDFIVHRGDINNPARVGYSDSTPDSETNFETISTIHSQV